MYKVVQRASPCGRALCTRDLAAHGTGMIMTAMNGYRRFWHPVAMAREVGEQPRQFRLLGENLVLYRTDAGVVAFKDLCIHRGAELSGGKVDNGAIVCPYHGWRYDRTGACVGIPSLPPGASIPAKARAIAYPVREQYDLVWVALDAPRRDLPGWPEEAWSNPAFRVFLVDAYTWNASAARVIENVLDFSHFNFVHQGYTELADGPLIKPYEVTRTDDGIRYVYDDTRLSREYTLLFPFAVHDRKYVVNAQSGGTWSESSDTRSGDVTILTFIASPVDETRTRIYVFTARNHSLTKPDADFAAGFDTIMEQDRVIVESQHPEQVPVDLSEEMHLRYPDAAAIAYRRMLRDLDQMGQAGDVPAASL